MSEPVQKISYITLSELSEPDSERYFREFCELYSEEFPPGPNAESPDVWRERFERPQPPPQPVFRIVVAVVNNKVAGGMVYEYYRSSRCGLLTYVVVEENARKKGIARQLTQKAILSLKQIAEELDENRPLLAVFGEVHNPLCHSGVLKKDFSSERLKILRRLKARWVDIPYVQPSLGEGQEREREQLLAAFCLGDEDPGPDSVTVENFLREFYQALGTPDPDNDPDFREIKMALDQRNTSLLCEFPQVEEYPFSFSNVAICFHYLYIPEGLESGNHGEKQEEIDCSVFRSFELDLLSYRFQSAPPFRSRCVTSHAQEITIVFPEKIHFESEGRRETLFCLAPHRERKARAALSFTHFFQSGIRIWHLVLTPARGVYFDVYGIIKLMKFYAGREEKCDFLPPIKFKTGTEEGVNPLSLDELFKTLSSGNSFTKRAALVAGSVQVITDSCLCESLPWERFFEEMHRFYKEGIISSPGQEKPGTDQKPNHKEVFQRCLCGIVQGIFDFNRMSFNEAIDILSPTFTTLEEYTRLHRSALTSIESKSDIITAIWDSIGISPYDILPHALLLHNEALVDKAEETLRPVLGANFLALEKLEEIRQRAERFLNMQVPNVFQYTRERTLIERAYLLRGSLEKEKAVRRSLDYLTLQINSLRLERQEQAGLWLDIILSVIVALTSQSVIFVLLEDLKLSFLRWPAFGLFLLIFTGAIVHFRLLKALGATTPSRRKKRKKAASGAEDHRDGEPRRES